MKIARKTGKNMGGWGVFGVMFNSSVARLQLQYLYIGAEKSSPYDPITPGAA